MKDKLFRDLERQMALDFAIVTLAQTARAPTSLTAYQERVLRTLIRTATYLESAARPDVLRELQPILHRVDNEFDRLMFRVDIQRNTTQSPPDNTPSRDSTAPTVSTSPSSSS